MTYDYSQVKLHGQPLQETPRDLFIPPHALEVYLEAFEGPLGPGEEVREAFATGRLARGYAVDHGDG